MADPFRKAVSGEPLRVPARTWNTFLDAARAHRDRQEDVGRETQGACDESGVVLVKNTTEADLARFDVLGIDGVLIAPADNQTEFLGRTAVTGVEPTADHARRFVILLEPVRAGALGRAMLHGVTRARLYVEEDQTVAFAAPTAGETGYLVPAASGAQVIWRVGGASADESDLKWALVRLHHAGPLAGEAQVASVTTSDAWVTRVTAHPLAPDGTADTSVTLTLKATDVDNLAAGYMVGYPSGDGAMEVGDKVGYVAGPGYSETDVDGWLVPYAGADGPVLAVGVDLPAPNILAGAGIWTEVVEGAEGVENVKVHFAPVVPGGGLAWDPAGPGDTSRPFVLTDAARGMARDNDGIFPDLAPKGGLTLSGNPGDADRDLMAKVDGTKALYIDQSVANAGIQVILASITYSHGPDWLVGPGLKYATSDFAGVLGLALDVAQYGGLKMSPLQVYADGNWGVTKDGETGELKVAGDADGSESGSGVGLNGSGEVALKDPYSAAHHAVVSCAGMYLDRTGRVMGWYYWDGYQDVWTSPWGYPEPS